MDPKKYLLLLLDKTPLQNKMEIKNLKLKKKNRGEAASCLTCGKRIK